MTEQEEIKVLRQVKKELTEDEYKEWLSLSESTRHSLLEMNEKGSIGIIKYIVRRLEVSRILKNKINR
jgi:hypothetical protein